MSAFDAVDGASSAASKWYRLVASKPERFKEVRPGNEMAFEVFKELARTRRRNAVCTENLNPDVMVMKSTKNRMRFDASSRLDRAGDRRIFIQ
jgi:hypothetical protein